VDTHSLLDCGDGRKLERFGGVVVDRPAPTAQEPRRNVSAWANVTLRLRDGQWQVIRALPDPWQVRLGGLEFGLRPTDAGQVGVFPEHEIVRAPLRGRLDAWVAEGTPPAVLDLFAFTGAVTLAAAARGCPVTYVDGSKPVLGWMRRNLELNGLKESSVRAIPEDVGRFVARAVRRGNRYDVVVLDPPSFGRGPEGHTFRIEADLDALLADVRRVLSDRPRAVLLTAHTEGWTASRLGAALGRAMEGLPGRTRTGELALVAESGAVLPAGIFAERELS
jgi:23S rRNA (cytosine1962-C5)-methyltransferase